MRKEKAVEIGGRKVKVREITAREIEMLYQNEAGIQMISSFIRGDHEHIPAFIARLTDLELEEIRELTGGQYIVLVNAVRKVNADFFATWRGEIERIMEKEEGSPSPKRSAGS